VSYNEPRPFGFSVRSYFDSGEAVWVIRKLRRSRSASKFRST